jgi:hypothetical protein
MKVSTALFTTITLSIYLVGCATHVPPERAAVTLYSNTQPTRYEPIYVMPNCKSLGGKTYCQWVEPRGYQQTEPTPAATNTQRIPGIAI